MLVNSHPGNRFIYNAPLESKTICDALSTYKPAVPTNNPIAQPFHYILLIIEIFSLTGSFCF